MSGVRVKVLRPLWLGGARHEIGDVLDVDERDAVALLEAGGRAALCNPADAPLLRAWAIAEVQRVLRQAGPVPSLKTSPWRNVG